MAAPTLTELRSALAEVCADAGLTVLAEVPDAIETPIALIVPGSAEFSETMGRGLDSYRFEVQVYASAGDPRAAQQTLDRFCSAAGANSIRSALWANKTLSLSGVNAYVSGFSGYSVVEANEGSTRYYMATLSVIVYCPGV